MRRKKNGDRIYIKFQQYSGVFALKKENFILRKPFFKIFVLCLVFSILAPFGVYAYDMPQTIRVGLEYKYKNVQSVPISDESIYVGLNYDGDFFDEAQVSGNGFSISVPTETIIDANEFYQSYEKAVEACEDINDLWGYDAVPAYIDEELWGIYVYDFGSDSASYAADTTSGNIVSSDKIMVLKNSQEVVMYFDGVNPQIHSDSESTTLSDRSYRGVIEFGRYTGGGITAVNVVGVEEYLYGVVPNEMPSTWEVEALKAQAVAARSYTLTRKDMNVHTADGYDVCDGTNCQIYMGYSGESERGREAVDSTENIVACYNGEPINAVFFSSSGGSTDNSENVWSDAVPYMRAVKEINENSPTWTREFSQEELSTLLAAKGKNIGTIESITVSAIGEYGRIQELTFNGTSGSAVLSKEETRTFCSGSSEGSLLSRMYTINSNEYQEVSAQAVNVEETGTIFVSTPDDTIEANIGESSVMSGDGSIFSAESPYYAITSDGIEELETSENNTEGNTQNTGGNGSSQGNITNYTRPGETVYPINGKFIFYGAGNGHGVGMSQYGANGMAELGYTYDEILKHYYTGITIE